MTEAQLRRFTISARHPRKDLGYDVELVASSEHYAISRTRATLVHKDRDLEWMDGTFTVVNVVPL